MRLVCRAVVEKYGFSEQPCPVSAFGPQIAHHAADFAKRALIQAGLICCAALMHQRLGLR